MKTILLTGSHGQLGTELVAALSVIGNVIACDRRALDLADAGAIIAKMRAVRPAIVVNAAAYTAVDRAEAEPALAHAINASAPAIVAEEAKRLGALLVHYSTDYVFDGTKVEPYIESDEPNPLNVYGRSKLAGERAIQASGADHLIFRTSWVYGSHGNNFLRTMLRLAAERAEIKVVNDQFGAPTWARDIARVTAATLALPTAVPRGLFHLSAAGSTNWFAYAEVIFATALQGRRQPQLLPIAASSYAAPAARPRNSLLNCTKLYETCGVELPPWQHSLRACIEAIAVP